MASIIQPIGFVSRNAPIDITIPPNIDAIAGIVTIANETAATLSAFNAFISFDPPKIEFVNNILKLDLSRFNPNKITCLPKLARLVNTDFAIVETMFVKNSTDRPIAILQSLILSPRVLDSSSTPRPRIFLKASPILLIMFPTISNFPARFIARS